MNNTHFDTTSDTTSDKESELDINSYICQDIDEGSLYDQWMQIIEYAPNDFDLDDYIEDVEMCRYTFYYTSSDDEIYIESNDKASSITTNVKHIDILTQIISEYWLIYNDNYRSKFKTRKCWTILKCLVKILAIHKKAVITANHPNRLKLLGVFNIQDDV